MKNEFSGCGALRNLRISIIRQVVVGVVFRPVLVGVFVAILVKATNASLKVSDYVVRVGDQSKCDLFADESKELDFVVPVAA